MIDYWSKLKLDECWSKKERFNKIMNYINGEIQEDTNNEEVDETEYGKISVNVTDITEAKIGGATVTLSNTEFTGTTGSAGGCNINNVPYDTYEMVVSCEGYVDKTLEITVDEEVESVDIVLYRLFSFTSYSDENKEVEWGTGTVAETGVVTDGYTQVEVLTNTPEESFVGQEFYVVSNAIADGTTVYPLFTDAGTTEAGIYVSIQ